jgi:hypothetical protein
MAVDDVDPAQPPVICGQYWPGEKIHINQWSLMMLCDPMKGISSSGDSVGCRTPLYLHPKGTSYVMTVRDPVEYIVVANSSYAYFDIVPFFHWYWAIDPACFVTTQEVVYQTTTGGAISSGWVCKMCGVTQYIYCCDSRPDGAVCRYNTSLSDDLGIPGRHMDTSDPAEVMKSFCGRNGLTLTVSLSLGVGCASLAITIMRLIIKARRYVMTRRQREPLLSATCSETLHYS